MEADDQGKRPERDYDRRPIMGRVSRGDTSEWDHGRSPEWDNTVFIGKKGVMSYVLAVVTQFNNGAGEVIIKARGKSISRAVDVAEIVRQRFILETKVRDIRISTEEMQSEEGGIVKVSAMEITLTK